MRMVAKRLKAVIQKRKANNTIRPSPDILNFHLVGRLSRAVCSVSRNMPAPATTNGLRKLALRPSVGGRDSYDNDLAETISELQGRADPSPRSLGNQSVP